MSSARPCRPQPEQDGPRPRSCSAASAPEVQVEAISVCRTTGFGTWACSAAAVARIKDSKVLRARRTEPRLRHDRSKFPFQRLLLDLQAGRTLLEAFGSDLDVVRRVGYRDHASLILYPPATSRHGCVPLGPDAEMGTPPT